MAPLWASSPTHPIHPAIHPPELVLCGLLHDVGEVLEDGGAARLERLCVVALLNVNQRLADLVKDWGGGTRYFFSGDSGNFKLMPWPAGCYTIVWKIRGVPGAF